MEAHLAMKRRVSLCEGGGPAAAQQTVVRRPVDVVRFTSSGPQGVTGPNPRRNPQHSPCMPSFDPQATVNATPVPVEPAEGLEGAGAAAAVPDAAEALVAVLDPVPLGDEEEATTTMGTEDGGSCLVLTVPTPETSRTPLPSLPQGQPQHTAGSPPVRPELRQRATRPSLTRKAMGVRSPEAGQDQEDKLEVSCHGEERGITIEASPRVSPWSSPGSSPNRTRGARSQKRRRSPQGKSELPPKPQGIPLPLDESAPGDGMNPIPALPRSEGSADAIGGTDADDAVRGPLGHTVNPPRRNVRHSPVGRRPRCSPDSRERQHTGLFLDVCSVEQQVSAPTHTCGGGSVCTTSADGASICTTSADGCGGSGSASTAAVGEVAEVAEAAISTEAVEAGGASEVIKAAAESEAGAGMSAETEEFAKRISASTEPRSIAQLAALAPPLPLPEAMVTWMIWMVHRVSLDDPDLTTLDFRTLQMPSPEDEPRVASKLVRAVAHNTHLVEMLLSYSNLHGGAESDALAQSLSINRSLRVLNIESNLLEPCDIEVILKALAENSTLEELRCSDQVGQAQAGPEVFAVAHNVLRKNRSLRKLGMDLTDWHYRDDIVRALIRNVEAARSCARWHQGKGSSIGEERGRQTADIGGA